MDENSAGFIVIQPWMVRLGLTGNELIIFALINGFSMDGKSTFNGGMEYLCAQTGIARRTAINCLNKLSEAGFIDRTKITKNGIIFSAYRISDKVMKCKNCTSEKTAHEWCKNCTSEKTALVQDLHSGSENFAHGVVKNLHIGSENFAPIKEIKINIESKEEVKGRARATRLTSDWQPSKVDIIFCQQQRPDLDVNETVASFKDYWISKPTNATKLDWSATWRNWVRKEKPGRQVRQHQSQNSYQQGCMQNAAVAAKKIFGEDYDTSGLS